MILIISYCYVKIFAESEFLQLINDHKRLVSKLYIYPIIMTINLVLLSCIRILQFYVDECYLKIIDFTFHTICSLSGLFIFIVFLLTPSVRKIIMSSIKSSNNSQNYEELNDFSGSVNLLCDTALSPKPSSDIVPPILNQNI